MHVTTRYVTISSTLPENPYPLTEYAAKPSSARAAADKRGGVRHGRIIPEKRGDMLIRGLWEIHMDVIIDVRFVDTDM